MKGNIKYDVPSCELCESRFKSIFCDLSSEELKQISNNKGCYFYKKGQLIFYEGNRPTGVYCVYTGKVKVYKLGVEGKEQIVRLTSGSDILGYRSLMCNETYTASAETLEDTCVCFIPKGILFELLEQNSKFSMKLMELLSKDLRSAEDNIANLAQKHVRERLAGCILLLKEKYGLEEDNATLSVSLTREDMANLVGTATESVIRLLQELKTDKIIILNKRKIKIINQQALVNLANIYD